MADIPGGKIIGGMGGHIFVGPMGSNFSTNRLEVSNWQITREWINAECTHSGSYGAITRRCVAFDWRFQCSLPFDQEVSADRILAYLPELDEPVPVPGGGSLSFVTVALTFFLGDAHANPEGAAMELKQKFYYAPSALIRVAQPVLDASRDVIRINIAGDGNSRLFLLPDENKNYTSYMAYLRSRGWAV